MLNTHAKKLATGALPKRVQLDTAISLLDPAFRTRRFDILVSTFFRLFDVPTMDLFLTIRLLYCY